MDEWNHIQNDFLINWLEGAKKNNFQLRTGHVLTRCSLDEVDSVLPSRSRSRLTLCPQGWKSVLQPAVRRKTQSNHNNIHHTYRRDTVGTSGKIKKKLWSKISDLESSLMFTAFVIYTPAPANSLKIKGFCQFTEN